MKRLIYLFIGVLGMVATGTVFAQNTPQSDYNYQLDQYRRHYSEYQIFKSDYLKNKTLNNEQKTVLSARSAIVARELTLASFARNIKKSILSYNTDQPVVVVTIAQLDSLISFYNQQAELARKLQTKTELSEYTQDYSLYLKNNQAILDKSQVVNKLAQLINTQQKADRAKAVLDSQLSPNTSQTLVIEGLQDIDSLQTQIRAKIALLIKLTESRTADMSKKTYFKKASQELSQINTLQLKLINRVIDLDNNYVRH